MGLSDWFRRKKKSGISADVNEKIARLAISAVEGHRPGIKPPADITDSMTWDMWRRCMHEMDHIPGWAPGRFCNRMGAGDDPRTGWVFGVGRGSFAIWNQSYKVCRHDHDDEGEDTAILTAVTHLPTGMGLGLFHDPLTASSACNLIEGMIDWGKAPEIDFTQESRLAWRNLISRANKVWEFNGIDYASEWHAHVWPGGPEAGIWTRKDEHLIANKPERLS